MRRTVLWIALAGCQHIAIRHKGPPRTVEVARRASSARLDVSATRTGPTTIELSLHRTSDVEATRTVSYAIGEIRFGSSRNPAIELFEMWVAIVAIAMPVIFLVGEPAGPMVPSDDTQIQMSWAAHRRDVS